VSRFVWPRLPAASVEVILSESQGATPEKLRAAAATTHPEAAPVAVGGPRVPESVIADLQVQLRRLADELGFPAELQRPRVADFDRPATRILHDVMQIIPADAASLEVWSFVALVVLPDVAVWRFPGRADERLLGHPRNVFRRLWWRAETVGSDLIDAPRGLGEDELVNLMERPTLAANARTARCLAQLLFERGDGTGLPRSELMRDVSKRVLRRQAVICLDALPDELLTEVLEECFGEAVASLRA